MSIHLSVCVQVVLVWLLRINPNFTINKTRHLSLRLVCIILGLLWSKSAVQDKVLHHGALPEALVVKVHCARWSPPMRGRSLRPFVVKVHCARQSPPMRGRSLRPFVVGVCCVRQCPPMRGRFLSQSPLPKTKSFDRGKFMRPTMAKSAVRDRVLHWGASIKTLGQNLTHLINSSKKGQDPRTSKANGKTLLTKSSGKGQDCL